MSENARTVAELAVQYLDEHYPAADYVDRIEEWVKLDLLSILVNAGFGVEQLRDHGNQLYFLFNDGSVADKEVEHVFANKTQYKRHQVNLARAAWERYNNRYSIDDNFYNTSKRPGDYREWDQEL